MLASSRRGGRALRENEALSHPKSQTGQVDAVTESIQKLALHRCARPFFAYLVGRWFASTMRSSGFRALACLGLTTPPRRAATPPLNSSVRCTSMQQTYHLIGESLTGFAFVVFLVLLALQFAAFRRHRHKSFLLLGLGSLCGIASGAIGAADYLFPSDLATMVSRLEVRSVFYVASALLCLWGTISLFNSYRALSAKASLSPSGSA